MTCDNLSIPNMIPEDVLQLIAEKLSDTVHFRLYKEGIFSCAEFIVDYDFSKRVHHAHRSISQTEAICGAAQKLCSDVHPDLYPIGCMAERHGSKESIPDGWAIANGENGTDDFRSLFSIGDVLPVIENDPIYYTCYLIQKVD